MVDAVPGSVGRARAAAWQGVDVVAPHPILSPEPPEGIPRSREIPIPSTTPAPERGSGPCMAVHPAGAEMARETEKTP